MFVCTSTKYRHWKRTEQWKSSRKHVSGALLPLSSRYRRRQPTVHSTSIINLRPFFSFLSPSFSFCLATPLAASPFFTDNSRLRRCDAQLLTGRWVNVRGIKHPPPPRPFFAVPLQPINYSETSHASRMSSPQREHAVKWAYALSNAHKHV